MATFKEQDGWYYFEHGEQEILLGEDNFLAHRHRQLMAMDRIAVQDPEDDMWWHWYRYDQEEELFEKIMGVAMAVGSILFRTTPPPDVQEEFWMEHQFTEDDYQELLGETE